MPTATCKGERDTLAFLGLLSHMYLNWDPAIRSSPAATEATHYRGLNIHALVIDNTDGEVLAIEYNRIHKDNSPVQHAEQLAIRAAMVQIAQKRARDASTTVEDYCRQKLFYAQGSDDHAFAYSGCTLVTSPEPCPMCAATLCVCCMKRVLYVVPDETEGGSWDGRRTGGKGLKDAYYPGQDLQYGQLGIDGSSRIGARTQSLYTDLFTHIADLRGKQTPDTQFFDHLHDDLKAIFTCFESIRVSDLMTTGSDLGNNTRTLADLKRLCNLKP